MSDDLEEPEPSAPETPDETETPPAKEKVGYANPPSFHRFSKGQSGNPRGRPKNARGFKSEIRDVLLTPVPVAGRKGKVSCRKAAVMKLAQKGLNGQGDIRALNGLVGLAKAMDDEEEARAASKRAEALEAEDLALIQSALQRLVGGVK